MCVYIYRYVYILHVWMNVCMYVHGCTNVSFQGFVKEDYHFVAEDDTTEPARLFRARADQLSVQCCTVKPDARP